MTDKELIVCYRDTVVLLNTIKRQIDWNNRNCLPVRKLIIKEQQLIANLIWAEDIIERIDNIQLRTAIRCRYLLGMSIEETAEKLETNNLTINRRTENAWSIIQALDKTNTG